MIKAKHTTSAPSPKVCVWINPAFVRRVAANTMIAFAHFIKSYLSYRMRRKSNLLLYLDNIVYDFQASGTKERKMKDMVTTSYKFIAGLIVMASNGQELSMYLPAPMPRVLFDMHHARLWLPEIRIRTSPDGSAAWPNKYVSWRCQSGGQ